MLSFDSEDNVLTVAQSCKYLRSGGNGRNRMSNAGEGVSCRICSNWNGDRCLINASDSILTIMDQ
jgi:hypothetical protein